jgi:uncharacterized protein
MKLDRILDGDGHVIERDVELFEYLPAPYARNTTLLGYPFFPALDGYNRGAVLARLGIHHSYEITPELWLETLDKVGLESTVLYPTAGLAFSLIQDPEWAVALARAYNDWFAHRYYGRSKRLRGVALVPLQSVPDAVKELRRAVTELGMVGVVLPANDADIGLRRGLGHPDFWPIYEEAERLGVPLATHGAPSMNLGINSFQKFAMTIALEHPIAQMIQVTSFVMEGVFDRFPRLRVGFLEAGTGWVPYMMGRLDRSYEVFNRGGRREFSAALQRKPSEHFASGRMYFSCEGGEPSLREVVARIGHKSLIFASDFPHEANVEHAMHELEELLERDDLSDAAKRGIFCGNIETFYGR